MREAHVSTEHPQTQEAPRFSHADADPGGSGDRQVPPPPGAGSAHRLIWRVRDRATFAALARARPRRRGALTLRQVVLDHDSPPQVALAVPRAAGTAVVRNRIRRRLRAVVAGREASLESGRAYLLSAGPGARSMTHAELDAALFQILGSA
jgi:ribonuclease P protein component